MLKANLFAALLITVSAFAADPWQSVDTILGQTGKAVAGDVHRYGWPRRDLDVRIGNVRVEPPLALGSWAAFNENMVMGDLVLRPAEVETVVRGLAAGGFDISAIHNHLLGESPMVAYVHYEGHGEPAALARTLHDALASTATPMTAATPATPTKEDDAAFAIVQNVLQRKGSMAGRVLQLGIPRAETITEGSMTIPPTMGVATAVNFQCVGRDVATTGDFVLIADEVNPVMRELEMHGIRVTALHSHMLRESPRLFFMHFWGVGAPNAIAEGIGAALSRVNVAK
ncbi:MAG TPA: DUF1259 domain-containing protein [Thermoanaerobaculia bacterium]|nr:DUF1259 domain-containing protein [Thermoanaerobaculia bacterium]